MNHYSQKDVAWKDIKLGTCDKTIGSHGCFISSLGMLAGLTPPIVNCVLKSGQGFRDGCMVDSTRAPILLGLIYDGKVKDRPDIVCIAETNYYGKGTQHFFVFIPTPTGDWILDPLDNPVQLKKNKYKDKMVSYRLFHEKKV